MSIAQTAKTQIDPRKWPQLFDYTMDRANAQLVASPHQAVTFGAFTFTALTSGTLTLSGLFTANNGIYDGLNSMSVYGMEIGTNSNGTYIKWGNGLMVCFNDPATATELTTSNSDLGGYYNSVSVIFPAAFLSGTYPKVIPAGIPTLGVANFGAWDIGNGLTNTGVTVVVNAQASTVKGKIGYLAIGMYK